MFDLRSFMPTQKEEIVRANFTVLQSDLKLIDVIKKRCMLLGIETNKSELIRAGIESLSKLSDTKLREILSTVTKLKVGRKKLNPDSV